MQAGTRRRWAIAVAVAAVLLAVYTAAGFFLVPWVVKRELGRYAERIDRHAEAREVRFNPYTYALEATDVRVQERDGGPIASIERVFVDFELTSLFRRGWHFSEIAVDGADIHVIIGRDGRLNLAQLAPRTPKDGERQDASSSPPAVVVRDLKLDRTTVHFADRSQPEPVAADAGPVSLHVTHLSTIAGEEGQYRVSAALPQGAVFETQGTMSLQPLAVTGSLKLAGLKLATAWSFLRGRLRIVRPEGSVALQAAYRYESKGSRASIRVSGADVSMQDVKLALPHAPLLELAAGRARNAAYDGASGAVSVESIELERGRYAAIVGSSGRFNWAELAVASKNASPPARWKASMPSIRLTDIAVRYEDRRREAPLTVDAERGDATLALALASDAAGTSVVAESIALELQRLALRRGADEPLLVAAGAHVGGGRVDTRQRLVSADEAVVNGAEGALVRDAEGDVPLLRAYVAEGAEEPAATDETPWRYRVGAAALTNARLAVGDAVYEPALRYDLVVERLAAKNVDAGSDSPIALDALVKIEQGGTLTATGSAAQDYSRASARVEASAIDLQPLQGLLARYATLGLRSGTASATATVEYARDGEPRLRAAGSAQVTGLALDDTRSRLPFLTWKQLAADGLTLTLAPDRLDIKEAVLDAPETAILISKERKVNLARVVKATGTAANEAAPARAGDSAEDGAFPVRVGRLRVRNGALDFADASLVLPFSTRITRVNGTVVGLATEPQSRAELKLGGRIATSGYASAEGGVNLRRPTDFMDINVKFQNVEMPPLSPYTATFAGRKIAGGRLWLDLDYKILKGQLAGANRVLLENVELGERVQAPEAMDLPLDLAVALLKDSQGRINMAVPVTGDVDDPQFDYGALIRDAIASAIGRIVTAPFRALASLFDGASAEELGKVRFAPGSARIYPPQRESLLKVAQGLAARPQLAVAVHGPYDPQRDAQRLKRDAVRRNLAQAMGQQLAPGEDAGPVPLSDPQTQRAIEKLYAARAGTEALRTFTQGRDAGGQSKDADQRRAYYDAMYDQLVATYPLADTALQELAAQRAQAVVEVLTEAGVDASRITIGSLRTVTDGSEPTIDADLELAAR